jgi:5-methyltetrahydrofolate corrinoid/iron sulfur protein methyltransferase
MFQIIGEKINGTRKSVGAAVVERNSAFIADLAIRQAAAGATWIDVNAGTHPDREPEDLVWLVETVQAAVDVPVSIDTANPIALAAALPRTNKTPLVNSISGEPARLEGVLPLAAANGCPVVALALDEKGIPTGIDDRLAVIRRLVEATRGAGIPDDRVYIDPLVMTIATNTESALIAIATMRAVRAEYPQAHMTSGLSNVSFGLPARSLVNRTYLTLAVSAGLDCAILDPLDRELRAALIATELLLGRDRHCLGYTRAFRAGLIGPIAPPPVATAPAAAAATDAAPASTGQPA